MIIRINRWLAAGVLLAIIGVIFAISCFGDEERVCYLTFDDGPSDYTPQLLQQLGDCGVKATFFVCGQCAVQRPEALQQIAAEGHTVALHTDTHDYAAIYQSQQALQQDILACQQTVYNILGQRVKLYRFPGGSSNTMWRRYSSDPFMMDGVIRWLGDEGFSYFDWNVSPEDANGGKKSADSIVASVVSQVRGKPRAVVLLHDLNSTRSTIQAIGPMVQQLQSMGYTFDTLAPGVAVHHSRH